MYGVPKDIDLAPFVGCSLDQICLGSHQIQFHFSGPRGESTASLSVEGRWALVNGRGETVDQALRDDQLPSEREFYRVHALLGRTVSAFELAPPRSLTLVFDDGAKLTVWDDSEQFESFHVEPGGYHI